MEYEFFDEDNDERSMLQGKIMWKCFKKMGKKETRSWLRFKSLRINFEFMFIYVR